MNQFAKVAGLLSVAVLFVLIVTLLRTETSEETSEKNDIAILQAPGISSSNVKKDVPDTLMPNKVAVADASQGHMGKAKIAGSIGEFVDVDDPAALAEFYSKNSIPKDIGEYIDVDDTEALAAYYAANVTPINIGENLDVEDYLSRIAQSGERLQLGEELDVNEYLLFKNSREEPRNIGPIKDVDLYE